MILAKHISSLPIRLVILTLSVITGCSYIFAQQSEPENNPVVINGVPVDPVTVDIDEPGHRTVVVADSMTWDLKTNKFAGYDIWEERDVAFNPSAERAVWMSALFPGLGQLYNRRYWKLPIIVGGYLGLAYATSWNNTMLTDYSRAYRDIMDNDASTNSYMNFFPPTTQESDLDKTWLTNLLKSRKDFYRRNRDLCIISMVGVYLLAMVDAYVDASLSHFDISPDLSIDITPHLLQDGRNKYPSIGMSWAFNF